MTYEAKATSLVEVGVYSPHRIHYNEITNDKLMRRELEFFEEKKDDSQTMLPTYQGKMTCYYNAKVKKRAFCIGYLVLWKVFLSLKELDTAHWEPIGKAHTVSRKNLILALTIVKA